MNGKERVTGTAELHDWNLARTVDVRHDPGVAWFHFQRGLRTVKVKISPHGTVSLAQRNWGWGRQATGTGRAAQVVCWMTEPDPTDGTQRAELHAYATDRGWVYQGITNGHVYALAERRVTVVTTKSGKLVRAQRNFDSAGSGSARDFHTSDVGNILPWFDPEPSAGARHVAALKEGIPAKPAQEAVKPTVKAVAAPTPDVALWRRLEPLKREAEALLPSGNRGPVSELTYSVDELEDLANALEDLADHARKAHRAAIVLWAERKYGPEMADAVREVHRREDAHRG
jgi:hypothetical protein